MRKEISLTEWRRVLSTRSVTCALILVAHDSKLVRLSQSITGVDIKHVKDLNMLDLVPGSKPIRLTIFSEHAIEYMKRLQAPVHKVLEVIGK